MQLTCTVEIDRPATAIWPWLVEAKKREQWMKGLVDDGPDTPGGPRVGARSTFRVKEGPKLAEYERVVTAVEPPKRLALEITGGSFQNFVMRIEYTLDEHVGRTLLTSRSGCELAGPLKLFGWLFGWIARRQTRSFLARLKQHAEAA